MPSLIEKGKPHIFLLDDPVREKKVAEQNRQKPEVSREYAAIVDALYRIVASRVLTDGDRSALICAFRSKFKFVYEHAGRRLVQLSHYFPEAQDDLRALLVDSSARIRLRVVQSLWSDLPPNALTNEIIAAGLADRSARVRLFAEQRMEMAGGRRHRG